MIRMLKWGFIKIKLKLGFLMSLKAIDFFN
jgi:hypothetical protein